MAPRDPTDSHLPGYDRAASRADFVRLEDKFDRLSRDLGEWQQDLGERVARLEVRVDGVESNLKGHKKDDRRFRYAVVGVIVALVPVGITALLWWRA